VTSVLLVKGLGGGWDASSLAAVQVKARPKDIRHTVDFCVDFSLIPPCYRIHLI
jgi:hypothetical protein